MEQTILQDAILSAGIALVTLILSIVIIRLVANIFIILSFMVAILAPPAWLYFQNTQGIETDKPTLITLSALIAFLVVLWTIPLWPISTLMQWTGKKEKIKPNNSD